MTRTSYFRPSEGQPQFASAAKTLVLKQAQGLQTIVNIGELSETHPFVFAILLPLNFVKLATDF